LTAAAHSGKILVPSLRVGTWKESLMSLEAPALPRSLSACLPMLWRRVLFPGQTAEPTRCRLRSLLLLLVLPGLLLYPCLSFRLFDPDEGRYAQIPAEMRARGEWLVPYLQNEPYLDKPPLLYWLVMGSYAVLGVHDWSARLVPALAVHGCILLTYLLGRRRVGERAACWGALALMLAPAFVDMGRMLLHDGLLTLWTTLAFFAAWEALAGDQRRVLSPSFLVEEEVPRLRWGWWLTAAAACGLGLLTKGPVILLLVGPPLGLHRRLTGTGARVGPWQLAAFLGVMLAVALPWYAGVCLSRPDFARYFLWEQNVVRFLRPFDHREPVWFYLPVVLLGLLPASLLLPGLVRFLLSSDPAVMERRSPELGLLLLAGGWGVLFFSLSGSKLATYVLPALPPLTLALGTYVTLTGWDRLRRTRGGAAGFYLLLLAAHYVVIPQVAEARSPLCRANEVLALCSDRQVPVVCFPRPLDSVAFYAGRADFKSYRSKQTPELLELLRRQPRTVVLLSHFHSPEQLRQLLPPGLRLARAFPTGDFALAVVERQKVLERRFTSPQR
jgi:4-amino-4-deoxy-L-arabinose transferase-like glycosyltransferase